MNMGGGQRYILRYIHINIDQLSVIHDSQMCVLVWLGSYPPNPHLESHHPCAHTLSVSRTYSRSRSQHPAPKHTSITRPLEGNRDPPLPVCRDSRELRARALARAHRSQSYDASSPAFSSHLQGHRLSSMLVQVSSWACGQMGGGFQEFAANGFTWQHCTLCL